MILNKVLFGIFIFFVLYYFSDRKNITWCLYGVIIYVLLLIAIEYLNNNKEIRINQEIEKNISDLKYKSNKYLQEQQNLKTEFFENNVKIIKKNDISELPLIKFDKNKKLPTPFNQDENGNKKLHTYPNHNFDKLSVLKKKKHFS